MSLSLSRVTQAWGSSLAELEPVPEDKLDVLLRICIGDSLETTRGTDAGDVLQRALPLSQFLEKAGGTYADRVVPALVSLLKELPHAWETLQNGPLQTQADFTQLMLDIRKTLHDHSMPRSAQQQLSKAVLHLLQQLYTAASKEQAARSSNWAKTGCNLLLRALTRSPRFVSDPTLPLLPEDANSMLQWLKQSSMPAPTAADSSSNQPNASGLRADAVGTAGGAAAAAGQQPASLLAWRDDKFYLLVTKLVLTATGLPQEGTAPTVAPSFGAAASQPSSSTQPAAMANGHSTSVATANGVKASVGWATLPHSNGTAKPMFVDPGLLCDLLEWSSTKVKLALQQLLGHSGASDAVPSREATTAAAQLAATCIHALRGGQSLHREVEQKLTQQVEDLLEIALAVGEAAASSAAAADRDGDKLLALGARVLTVTIPFVAAAAGRSSLEQQLELTSRLQQLMLVAASLAGRHGVVASARSSAAGSAAAPASASGTLVQIPEGRSVAETNGTVQEYHRHHTLGAHRPHQDAGSKLRAGTSKLATRKAKKQGFAGFGALGRRGASPPHFYRQVKSPVQSREPSFLAGGGFPANRSLAALQQQGAGALGVEDGMAEDVQRELLVSEAELSPSPEDLEHPWSWDVTQALTVLSSDIKSPQLPLSCGIGSFLLARAATEALCEALAASWASGSAAPVRCMMLLPQSGAAEKMVTVLALGRLYVKLADDPTLGQLLLPLLADVLSRSNEASLGMSTTGLTIGQAISQTLSIGGAAPAAGGSNAVGQLSAADVAGAVVCALEGMASACVQQSKDTWLYDQALQLLLMMYREPTPLSLQLLAGRTASPATAGLLADALHLLAVGLEDAPQRARQDLRTKLLLLFSDVAASVGDSSGIVTSDLGDLLVAVAVAAEGLQPRTLRLLGGSSHSSRMSMHDIQVAQREDASTTRLFRNLWLYTATYKLVNPSTALVAGASSSSSAGSSVQEWQIAAGRLAAVTPLLVVGTDSYHEADMVERLKVELEEQLAQVGSLGSNSSLSAVLISLLGGKAALEGLNLPHPTEAVLLAFIVAVALSELSRAALAPLPDLDDDPIVSCPVSVTLGYLKGVLPDGTAAAWVGEIVKRAAQLYIARLLTLAARQEQEEEDEGCLDSSYSRQTPAPALAYAEQLACALIANLGGGLGPGTVTEGTSAPVVAALADELLPVLLEAFPALLHSQLRYCALLVQLQREEGDIPMGQVQVAYRGLVWECTKSWVQAAAEVAPLTTEALLHSFLTSSDALPGATPPAWLADSGHEGLSAATALGGSPASSSTTSMGSLTTSPVQSSGRQARVATQAAFRRAADLLQLCAKARRQQEQGQVGDGAYEGALGLTRKLHYTGYVQGLMNGRGSAAAAAAMLAHARVRACGGSSPAGAKAGTALPALAVASVPDEVDGDSELDSEASEQTQLAVAEEIATQLELALQQTTPRGSHFAVALLSATALLAVQPDAFSYSQLGMRLLGALARTPLRHLTPETMRLSQFSWCWASVESPEVLVPLISSLGSAWIWTLDQRVGLFGGLQHQQHAEESGAGGGHLVSSGEEDSPVVHDESMLQAISAHFLWLSYLMETWAVVSRLRDSRTAAARTVYGRLLAASLRDPSVLSHHPAAVGAYFRLLTLGLVYGQSCLRSVTSSGSGKAVAAGADVLLLFDRILQAALLWFKSPPRYFARCTRKAAAEQLAALQAFIIELASVVTFWSGGKKGGPKRYPSYDASLPTAAHPVGPGGRGTAAAALPHPVWGDTNPDVSRYVELLQFLCGEELSRLRVWTEPLKYADASRVTVAVPWREYAVTAWQVEPALALSLLDHFPAVNGLCAALENLVVKNAADSKVQSLPKAALLLAAAKVPSKPDVLQYLAVWTPGSAAQGLQLLSGPEGTQAAVRSYAVKCLFNEKPEKLVFFLPQLVQLLRGDTDGAITNFFLTAASHSDLFGHQLIWALNSEAKPPEEAFNPEVKRSGWQPPKDTGLWETSARVKSQIESQMTPAQREYWQAEGGYFQQVTELSGYLYKFSKDERRVKLQEALTKFQPPRTDLYIPTNPEARVKRHIPSSGACMQSAAKVGLG
eukprot:GHUV01013388.1.p1 GENE.GHUV01013388.1~~GHUV01013388.1.p1  ORF type:complete len:2087 (+),score=705.77 GHUV01013388.1:215-6475(+)